MDELVCVFIGFKDTNLAINHKEIRLLDPCGRLLGYAPIDAINKYLILFKLEDEQRQRTLAKGN